MIKLIPEWLEKPIQFLNNKFPDDEDVDVSILYGFDSIGNNEDFGYAAYNTDVKCIVLADPDKIAELLEYEYGVNGGKEEARVTTIQNLFHEYHHHQQNIHKENLDEYDAERFAVNMYEDYL